MCYEYLIKHVHVCCMCSVVLGGVCCVCYDCDEASGMCVLCCVLCCAVCVGSVRHVLSCCICFVVAV